MKASHLNGALFMALNKLFYVKHLTYSISPNSMHFSGSTPNSSSYVTVPVISCSSLYEVIDSKVKL